MRHHPDWSTPATLHCNLVRSSRLTNLPCHKCKTVLEIHQPSVENPHQFLATCPTCGAWFRLETRAGSTMGVMVALPEISPLLTSEERVTQQVV